MTEIKKKDFVEIKFSAYANGQIFDSNIEEDMKKINPDAKPNVDIIVLGQGMIIHGLDNALEGKEIGKEYEIRLTPKESFGERRKDMIKTIPLKVFTEKNIRPQAGLVLTLDQMYAKIIAVSGARVITDFNNPLSGKDITYKVKIVRKVEDEKEKVEALFKNLFRFVPEFEVGEKIKLKGDKNMEVFVKVFSEKFKELIGKELDFELKEEKVEKKEESKVENTN